MIELSFHSSAREIFGFSLIFHSQESLFACQGSGFRRKAVIELNIGYRRTAGLREKERSKEA
jgi:hypothetical protein